MAVVDATANEDHDEWKTVAKPRRQRAPAPVIITQTAPIKKKEADADVAVALPPPPAQSPAIIESASVDDNPLVVTYDAS